MGVLNRPQAYSDILRVNFIQIRQVIRAAAERMRAFFERQTGDLVFWICACQVLAGRAGIFGDDHNNIFYAWIDFHAFE
jgi:hypothetical protein